MKIKTHGKLNNKGQFVIEAILLIVVLLGVFMLTTRTLREQKVFQKLIAGNWPKISGMAENGVWEDPSTGRKKHPNQLDRSWTYDPQKQ